MKMSKARIKLISALAILLVVALFVVVIFQLVSISQKKNELALKQAEIDRIQQELAYYENQKSEDKDDKESDNNIVLGE